MKIKRTKYITLLRTRKPLTDFRNAPDSEKTLLGKVPIIYIMSFSFWSKEIALEKIDSSIQTSTRSLFMRG